MFSPLVPLFITLTGTPPLTVDEIAPHASQRRIARMSTEGITYCGVINEDVQENEAFLYLAEHFSRVGIRVPKIFIISDDRKAYLMEDLGDVTLYNLLLQERGDTETFSAKVGAYYSRALEELAKIQIVARENLDFSRCYPKREFDRASMIGDMEYFRDKFLVKSSIPFRGDGLTQSFENLATTLMSNDSDFFMYRDFQSRNIMVKDGELFFIDFQGGRKGPLQYDLVSILYQASARISEAERKKLIAHYVDAALKYTNFNKASFIDSIPHFALVRMLQVLGTYGKVGLGEGKAYFQKSIPLAANNLKELLTHTNLWSGLDELKQVISRIVDIYGK